MTTMEGRFTASTCETFAMLALPFLGGMASSTVESKPLSKTGILFSTIILSIFSQDHQISLAIETFEGRNMIGSITLAIFTLGSERWTATFSRTIEKVLVSFFTSKALIAKRDDITSSVVMFLCRKGHFAR